MGLGRWGKNLLREFEQLTTVRVCCTKTGKGNQQWLSRYPDIKSTKDYGDVLKDRSIDAVAIATPINTHFELAYRALQAGKHVFVEKPLATKAKEAKLLVDVAEKQKRVLFVGNVFLYHPVFRKIKQIAAGDPPIRANFLWKKLGTFNEVIVWNLLTHDVSIAMELFGMPRKTSMIRSDGYVTKQDALSVDLSFAGGRRCSIEIGRLSNSKIKSITILTSKNLFVWEDEQLHKFDRRKEAFQPIYRSTESALTIECKEYLGRIKRRQKQYSDVSLSLNVVTLLSNLVR